LQQTFLLQVLGRVVKTQSKATRKKKYQAIEMNLYFDSKD